MSNHDREEKGKDAAALDAAVQRIEKQESQALAKISQRVQEEEIKAVAEILKQSREEIEWVHKAYFFIGGAVAMLVAIGIWFTYHAASEWKSDIEKVVTDAEVSATNHFAQFESNTVKQLEISSGEITNLIARTFESSNITHIVENVAAVRAGTILEEKVRPVVERYTNQLMNVASKIDDLDKTKEQQDKRIEQLNGSIGASQTIETNLQSTLSDARSTLTRLDEQSSFITTSILADHDDRDAYEQLIRWSKDSSFKYKDSAFKLKGAIQMAYFQYHGSYTLINWDAIPMTNHESWNNIQIGTFWNVLPSALANAYVEFVSSATNITAEQRLDFLRGVYLKDSRNSLLAQNTAAEKAAEFLKANYNPSFEFASLEKAWMEFSKTNRLFVSTKSDSTNLIDEILFPATDTNRVRVLMDGKDAKLISFKLRQPVVAKTLEGKFSDVQNGACQDMSVTVCYKNFAWGWFPKDLSLDVSKFEIRYEPDVTQTNVETLKIEGDEIVFENSKRFRLPSP